MKAKLVGVQGIHFTNNSGEEVNGTKIYIVEIIRSNFKTITYFCMADEEGSMFHTHIYVVFASRVRFSMVKRYFPEAHIEKCRGSVLDNVNYIVSFRVS